MKRLPEDLQAALNMEKIMLNPDETLVIVVDIQERLMPALSQADTFVAASRRLIEGASALNIPIIITEQYPKGLGRTIADIRLLCPDAQVFEKTQFSALTDEVQAALKQHHACNIVLIGCEAHICILQTVLALRAQNYSVYLPQECLTSRTESNKNNGLLQAQHAGAIITNIETLLFQCLQDAKHPAFKTISKLIQ